MPPVQPPADHPHRARPGTRSGSLQRSLLALVLVPLVGLVGLVGYAVQEQAERAGAAAAATDEVRSAVALDVVRAAVAQEVVPVLGRAVLGDPATAASVGLDGASLAALPTSAGADLGARLSAAQRTTDEAVAAAGTTGAAARAAAAGREVRRLRAQSGDGDLSAVFGGYRGLVARLAVRVGDHLQRASAAGLDDAGTRAVADLQRISRASSLASVEVPLYFSSLTTSGEERLEDRAAFLSTWGGYAVAATEVTSLSSPRSAARWTGVVSTPEAVRLEALLRTAALQDGSLEPAQFLALTEADSARDAALGAVVARTGADAVTAAGGPAREARDTLRVLVAVCALLVAGTLAAALLLRRWIAAPLGRLAAQARAVSDGELLDVEESGPAEVRTVARGLAAAVDNLRRVRDQAQAVADGALDADVVHRPVHGPLGEVVHDSVRRMVGALSERERLQADLAHQASHDALTGLPNRAQALLLVEAALHRAARSGGRIGLLFVDLDHFKAVNDTHGHSAGDELLRVLAARMAACLRGGDVVARLGGDEFVVLVEGGDGRAAGTADAALVDLGRRLIDAVSEPVALSGRHAGAQVRVGASVGRAG
ncbi:diguanylate cyclase, partial [Kineococcus sp. T13]|uniref:diguanylate cyclase domain-containing protein n=1 Tax=Kineococcus vitellinus TaxID=2696565 RepID=UPI001411EBEE|nr:diguanylate cyclase [Kineococcus vitellinus]